jgi:hypothetical protein
MSGVVHFKMIRATVPRYAEKCSESFVATTVVPDALARESYYCSKGVHIDIQRGRFGHHEVHARSAEEEVILHARTVLIVLEA